MQPAASSSWFRKMSIRTHSSLRLVLLFLISLHLHVKFNNVVHCVSENGVEALRKWKATLDRGAGELSSWVQNPSPCSGTWVGVGCDSSGSITVLNLSRLALGGSLSGLSFLSLPNLTTVNLTLNSFHGSIPANIANLSKLAYLDLSFNYLTGNIPSEIWSLTSLTHCDLSNNFLTGVISSRLGKLSKLSYLSLFANNLSGPIPSTIGNLTSLTQLVLCENHFSGQIPPEIGKLTSLFDLKLFSNRLEGSLPPELNNLTNLIIFVAADNRLKGSIPDGICKGGLLQRMNLRHNNFTGRVPKTLRNCTSLFRLRLEGNQLTGNISEDFAINSHLSYLDLSGNRFYGELSPRWGQFHNLTYLNVSGNRISGEIPPDIAKLTQLAKFDLSSNCIFGEIPKELATLKNLLQLSLHNNRLSGEIPAALGMLVNLQYLDVGWNNFSGPIPKDIGECSNLLTLNLNGNRFVGGIPIEMGKLHFLYALDLSHNLLTGVIPSDLQKLHSLQFLNLSHNVLSGFIPLGFNGMKGLMIVDVSFNKLQGMIPNIKAFKEASFEQLRDNKGLCGNAAGLKACDPVNSFRSRTPKRILLLIFVPVSGSLFLLMLFILVYVRLRGKGKNELSGSQRSLMQRQRLSYEDLSRATDGFSVANLVGVGAFGSVYKGSLEGGMVVAVKVLNLQQRGASKSFMAECDVLRYIRHRNLLKVVTSCSSIDHQGNDFKALVYEFMPNGSLEKSLHPSPGIDNKQVQPRSLSLLQRINIAIDIATAIDYLHNLCSEPVIHRDLKPSNVLLDSDMTAHVGDFGLAKFLSQLTNPDQSSSLGIKGTVGYTAPEYGLGNEESINGDVYSYGIVLLELVTGRKPTEDEFEQGLHLHDFVRRSLPDNLKRVVDSLLLTEEEDGKVDHKSVYWRPDSTYRIRMDCVASMLKIGVACSVDVPHERMQMAAAIRELLLIKHTFIASRNC